MKLSRLLVGLISLLWVLVFVGTLGIVVQRTKDFLPKTLESHAQDTSTFLGLAITHSGRVKDVETVERMTAAIFDRGYYREILVKAMDGKELVGKRVEQAVEGVPQPAMLPQPIVALYPDGRLPDVALVEATDTVT